MYTNHIVIFLILQQSKTYRIVVQQSFPSLGGRTHCGRVVTLSPPTSEAGVRFPAWSQVGKLVIACRWSAVYSTEP